MDDNLSFALGFHRAGMYADAARCYHALLTRQPAHADALHLFGIMHHECGHSDRAAEMINRAVALRPGAPAFHSNLAEIYRKLGLHEQAVESCRAALRIQPDYPEAVDNLGLALQDLGRHEQAVDAFAEALRLRPDFALAWNNMGVVLRELGRQEEALAAFRSASAFDPEMARARANLGQALVDAGEIDEALEHCLAAVRIDPPLAAAHNNLGNAYAALKRRPEAIAAYAKALRLAPELGGARVHANLGLALQGEGEVARAIAYFLKAVELEPEDPDLWQRLANTHVSEGDFAAAIPCCERVVALNPGVADRHVDLGVALVAEGRTDEARACYRSAMELEPDCARTLHHRGQLHEILGEMAEAESDYRRAREIHPAATFPLACLATLLRGKLPDDDVRAIRDRLDDPNLEDGHRSALLFGLAHVCDARGEHAAATASLDRANALALAMRSKGERRYDPSQHARHVDDLIEIFSPEVFSRLAGIGDATPRPIFIVGMPRSGTTLVEQVLASHPGIHGAGELGLMKQAIDAIAAQLGPRRGGRYDLSSLEAATIQATGRNYLERVQAILERDRPGIVTDRFVDKMPDNYLYLGLVAILFPRATLIHVRRDPRDVALSCWMTNFSSIRWANDPDHLAARFHEHKRMMRHWQSALPIPVHEVVYEQLVDDLEPQARRLIAACGLGWEPSCLRFHETRRRVRTASVTQVRQPLYRKSVARWEHYRDLLADLFARLPVDQGEAR